MKKRGEARTEVESSRNKKTKLSQGETEAMH